jgi:hypothetical protein
VPEEVAVVVLPEEVVQADLEQELVWLSPQELTML